MMKLYWIMHRSEEYENKQVIIGFGIKVFDSEILVRAVFGEVVAALIWLFWEWIGGKPMDNWD